MHETFCAYNLSDLSYSQIHIASVFQWRNQHNMDVLRQLHQSVVANIYFAGRRMHLQLK